MVQSIIKSVREQLVSRLGPKTLTVEVTELTKDLIGASVVGGDPAPEHSRRHLETHPTHALYTISLPVGESFPTDIEFASIIIRVEAGSVKVTSPAGYASVSVGKGASITDGAGTVLAKTGSVDLGAGKSAILGKGNAVSSADEALEVTAIGATARLTVSVVIAPRDTTADFCWICPEK